MRRVRYSVYLGCLWLSLLGVLALVADLLPLRDVSALSPETFTPPHLGGDFLGTDNLGRSLVSRVIYGARVSLAIGAVAVIVALVVGGLIGLLAGHFGGVIDGAIGLLVNSLLALPALILLVVLSSVFEPNLVVIGLELALLATPLFVRIARANTIVYGGREFLVAARTMGATNRRIIFRELLPNVLPPLLSYAFVISAFLIVAEASLSFLGLGIPPPTPSWGNMIASGKPFMAADQGRWFVVFVPAGALFLTVLSFNAIGDWLREKFSVRETSATL